MALNQKSRSSYRKTAFCLVVASAQISNFFLSDLALMADFFEKYSIGKINNGYDK